MKKKIINLVEKQGFILFLFICVFAVAGGTLYLSVKNLNTAKENANREEVSIVEEEPVERSSAQDDYSRLEDVSDIDLGFYGQDSDESNAQEEQAVDENEELVEEIEPPVEEMEQEREEEAIEVSANEPEREEKNEDADFVEEIVVSFMPVDGKIVTEYTKDVLVYSDTLESWIGHGGIDIKADEGSIVKCILSGTVEEVYEDKLWGIVIVIDHGDGLQTKYANLGTDKMVEKGVRVEKGDHISKVGKTAKIEMHLDPHLHFEARKDGKLIDPRSIMD